MGQYYTIVNVDKKEVLYPFGGVKLMEFSYDKTTTIITLMNLLKNKWKGDRVYVVGDYADDKIYNKIDYNWHDTYMKVCEELGVKEDNTLYNFIYSFEQVEKSKAKTTPRYIYNHAKKQVVDLMDCEKDSWGYTIAPISLLLAMGNDRGGGDFHEGYRGYEHVGEWVSTSSSIEVSAKPLPGCEDYEKFIPGFYEG